jgi:hypothetical protein
MFFSSRTPTVEEVEAKQQQALQAMRDEFKDVDGIGLPMNDSTFARYLRAR